MTRTEADNLVCEYDDALLRYTSMSRMLVGLESQQKAIEAQFHAMNAVRERLIDRLCGEEATPVETTTPGYDVNESAEEHAARVIK